MCRICVNCDLILSRKLDKAPRLNWLSDRFRAHCVVKSFFPALLGLAIDDHNRPIRQHNVPIRGFSRSLWQRFDFARINGSIQILFTLNREDVVIELASFL